MKLWHCPNMFSFALFRRYWLTVFGPMLSSFAVLSFPSNPNICPLLEISRLFPPCLNAVSARTVLLEGFIIFLTHPYGFFLTRPDYTSDDCFLCVSTSRVSLVYWFFCNPFLFPNTDCTQYIVHLLMSGSLQACHLSGHETEYEAVHGARFSHRLGFGICWSSHRAWDGNQI